jgi:4-methylaminobutanoate oxidase (formaldehyde-forming)
VTEALGNTYRLLYPDHQPHTCRGAKKSVLHDRLIAQNAYFKNVSGWESPNWYAPEGVQPTIHSESFGRPPWFSFWEAEHKACREGVALFDMSFMSKFLVQGYDAGTFLNWLSTANVDGESSRISYTQWLNELGYLEADLTVTKLADDQFLIVATDTMHNHVQAHMNRRLSRDRHVTVTDVTARYAQINVQGPRSRELIQRLTDTNMATFEFRTAREIEIGIARALCIRITYVGEFGYELLIPTEQATYVYDRIVEEGQAFGLKHAGLKALGSLRLEKGYRDYGHDLDNTDTIVDAGLSFTCDFGKSGGFLGMEHVLDQKKRAKEQGGPSRRMAQVLVPGLAHDPLAPLLYHGEVLWRNAERISDIRSGSYGHTVGGGVGLTMLQRPDGEPIDKAFLENGEWQLEIANQLYPCEVSFGPLYDPKNTRLKG